MSQVMKFKNGNVIKAESGTNQEKPKKEYGHLIIDGIDLGNSEELYNAFAQHARSQSLNQGRFYETWLNKLNNGEDVVFGTGNTVNDNGGFSDTRAGKRSNWRRFWDDTLDTERNHFSDAIATARRFSFTPKTETKSKTSHNNNKAAFDFNGEGDARVYSETNPGNIALASRINPYLDWLENSDWGNANEFSLAVTPDQESAIRAWYNQFQGTPEEKRAAALAAWNEHLAAVKGTKGGYDKAPESSRDFFNYFNIGDAPATSTPAAENDGRKALAAAGYNPDLADILGDNFTKDKDGVYRLNPDSTFNLGIPDLDGKNIWFNDDFYTVYADPRLRALKGYTYYNGALYAPGSKYLTDILNTSGGFNELMNAGNWDEANNRIMFRFSEPAKRNPEALGNDRYSEFLAENPHRRFNNLTGEQTLVTGLPEGQQIVQYVDLDNPVMINGYRTYQHKYALLDVNGKKIRDLSASEIQSVENPQSRSFTSYLRVPDQQDNPYSGYVYQPIVGQNDEETGIRFYQDPNNSQNAILRIDGGLRGSGISSGQDIKLPAEVAEILSRTKDIWLPSVIGNANNRQKFAKHISSLIQSSMRRSDDPKAWEDLGLSREDALALHTAIWNAWQESKKNRRQRIVTRPAELNKNGGVIKNQFGGKAGSANTYKGATMKIDKKVQNPANAGQFGDKDSWTSADALDITALVADLGSLGLAFTPAYMASAATGATSSLMRFAADRQRGKNWWGSLGNLGLNLGMDATLLLPGVGAASQSARVVSKVRKALPTLLKAASIYGIGNTFVNSVKKIANNEPWSVRDVSNIVNGLTGVVALRRTGLGNNKQKASNQFVDHKVKVGETEVTLKGSEIENVMSQKGANAQNKALHDLIKSKNNNFTEQQVSDAVKSVQKTSGVWKFKKISPDLKKSKVTESTGDNFMRGTGKYAEYNQALIENRPTNTARLNDVVVGVGNHQVVVPTEVIRNLPQNPTNTQIKEVVESVSKNNPNEQNVQILTEAIKRIVKPGTQAVAASTTTQTPLSVALPQFIRNADTTLTYKPIGDRVYKNGGKLNNDLVNMFNEVNGKEVVKGERGLEMLNPISETDQIRLTGQAVPQAQQPQLAETQPVNPYNYNSDFRGGDFNLNSQPIWNGIIKTGLGALDYGSMAWGRRKVHDQIERGLKESLYKETTPRLIGVSTATPIEDAAVRRYDEYIGRGLTTPLTSDNTANTQSVLSMQANALQGRDQAVRQQSAAALNRELQNQQIVNKQQEIDASAENNFRARLAGLRMNLAQNDASLTTQTAQSIQNLAREWRTQFNDQTKQYNQLAYNSSLSDKTNEFNNGWLGLVRRNHNDAWSAWNALSSEDKQRYGNDFTTWAQQSQYWDSMKNDYESNRSALRDATLDLYKQYMLNPELQWMYRQRYGVQNAKKGGTLRGNTRYKHEPDEEIWINQNKASHRAVAKLNDNIVKIFLKTLK